MKRDPFAPWICSMVGGLLAGLLLFGWYVFSPMPAHGVVIGSSGGAEIQRLSENVGHALPAHKYGQLSGKPITDAMYVNISFGDWRSIRTHEQDVHRWAAALRDTGKVRLVSLDHEPMTDKADGTPTEYRKAARWMADEIRAIAPKVRIVFTTTWVSIQNGIGGVHAYYPGKRWVDYVSTNIFNRPDVRGWQSFPKLAAPLLKLSGHYGKKAVVSEWASDASPQRARWVTVAGNYMAKHRGTFAAAYYYQSPSYDRHDFRLSTPAEFAAMRTLIGKAR